MPPTGRAYRELDMAGLALLKYLTVGNKTSPTGRAYRQALRANWGICDIEVFLYSFLRGGVRDILVPQIL